MDKKNKTKVTCFLILLSSMILMGIVITKHDIRYKDFAVIRGPLGDAIENNIAVNTTVNEEEKIWVNINTNDKSELMKLNGIGEKMSERIIGYRRKNGDFDVIEDLMRVAGIGEKKFKNIKDCIYVGIDNK